MIVISPMAGHASLGRILVAIARVAVRTVGPAVPAFQWPEAVMLDAGRCPAGFEVAIFAVAHKSSSYVVRVNSGIQGVLAMAGAAARWRGGRFAGEPPCVTTVARYAAVSSQQRKLCFGVCL